MASKNGGRSKRPTFTDQEALLFHSQGRPGKLEVVATKPMATQRDLSLAYSPGVAVPVLAIAKDPSLAYDYTAKGNFVAVISNGTAILGLGKPEAHPFRQVLFWGLSWSAAFGRHHTRPMLTSRIPFASRRAIAARFIHSRRGSTSRMPRRIQRG